MNPKHWALQSTNYCTVKYNRVMHPRFPTNGPGCDAELRNTLRVRGPVRDHLRPRKRLFFVAFSWHELHCFALQYDTPLCEYGYTSQIRRSRPSHTVPFVPRFGPTNRYKQCCNTNIQYRLPEYSYNSRDKFPSHQLMTRNGFSSPFPLQWLAYR